MGWKPSKTPDAVHFRCSLEPIRPRRQPYANEPGSPWVIGSIDLTMEQTRRLIDAFQAATTSFAVNTMSHYHSISHEPENP